MHVIRFFKIPPVVILALLSFYSTMSQAGTISVTPVTPSGGTVGVGLVGDAFLYYTIRNTSATSNLTITNVTGTSEFLIYQPSVVVLLNRLIIAPLASYSVIAQFKPSTAGNRSGNITITSDDPVTPTAVVAATGYGGTEASIRLTPITPFEVEFGQGTGLRANVIFDNGAIGPALLNWTSSNPSVATVARGEVDNSVGGPKVSTGNVRTSTGAPGMPPRTVLGTTTITVSGVRNPLVTASVPITVVAATPHEFLGTSVSDAIVRVKDGAWGWCYNFPEFDLDNRPIYDTHEIGVTTPTLNTIGSIYVTVADSESAGDFSDEIYHINACDPNPISGNVRTTLYNDPLSVASFQDLVVESNGNAVASNATGSTLWQLTPRFMSASLIPRDGLPADDIGSLAIDSFDNIYMSNLIRNPTATQVEAAIYVRPKVFTCAGGTTWCPIAAVFGARDKSSTGIPGMAAIYEGNKGYAMKYITAIDKAVVERYIDLNADGNYYNVNTSGIIVPDLNEIVEVAVIDAGSNITVDANRNLIVSVSEPLGHTVVKMTDKNADNDFKDPGEYKVIYQSDVFTQLKDIAFAAPCGEKPPQAVIAFIPASGLATLDTPIKFLGNSSSDPCRDPITYSWTNEDIQPNPPVICTTFDCQMTYTGLPALHKFGLTVRDPAGLTNKVIATVKAGPPALNGFWPANGKRGTGVFLFGKNFSVAPGTLPAAPVVRFNNGILVAGTFQRLGPDLLYVSQPAGVGGDPATVPAVPPGKITVTTAISTATTLNNFNEPPTTGVKINGLWPSAVKKRTFFFLFGQGFVGPGIVITVNGVRAGTFQALGTTLLTVLAPADPAPPAPPLATGPVCITVPNNPTVCSSTNLVILP